MEVNKPKVAGQELFRCWRIKVENVCFEEGLL